MKNSIFSLLLMSSFLILLSHTTTGQTDLNLLKAQKVENPIENNFNTQAKFITDSVHYDGANSNSIGTGGAETFGVYMYMPTDTTANYDGKQIKQIKLYINTVSNVASAQIEIHQNQTEGAVYTQSFIPQEGWNTVVLNTAYNISASQDLYVGYFIEATGGYPAGCDAGPTAANGNGDWILLGGSWSHLPDLNAALAYNWNIRAMIGTTLPNDAGLAGLDLNNYQLEGDIFIEGTVTNYGSNELSAFDLNWQVDGGTIYTETINGLTLATNESYNFTHTDLWSAALGAHTLDVWISNINGAGDDDNTANDSLSRTINVVTFIPEKKVFGEEATGTWCGWCPRGHVYMDYMAENYPDTWIGVAVHNGDPMVNTTYDNGLGNIIGGYPSGLVDRTGGDTDPSAFESAYLSQIDQVPPASIDVNFLSWDPETREISFELSSEFVVDYTDLRFNAVVAEDHVTGANSGYNQANYYSGGGSGPMGGYEDLPNPVPAADMVYRHVARDILGGWDGTESSLPATIATGETHSYTYNYTLSDEWDGNEINLIGLLIDQNSGAVLNANDVKIPSNEVTILVTDEADNPLQSAQVAIEGEQLTTDINGETTISLIDDKYYYSVSRNGFENNADSVVVSGSAITDTIVMVALPTSEITFNVDMSTPITTGEFDPSNDTLIIGGSMNEWAEPGTDEAMFMGDIDEDGFYTLTVPMPDGEYDYKYFIGAGWNHGEWDGGDNRPLTVAGEAQNIDDIWANEYLVAFLVTESSAPVQDATISIDGNDIVSDAEGNAFIGLTDGEYSYTASLTGYADMTGEVTVAGANTEVEIGFVGISDQKTIDFAIYPNPAQQIVHVEIDGAGQVSVINELGQILKTKLVNEKATFDFSDKTKGVYFIRVETKNTITTKSVIIN
ncbi:hypothetical protein L21SP5_03137 [Salinivirga cyanobacteriivorans]|uniref:Uncharacterized protein n=1 Tax=Salinivirga cyanobacteriivorans TaxID=1307839 RepID=A0A0S2I3C1_9BACT|nr:T9SS type A sorting domain-containing protein [Salinivirga cyanobacteriivorans]ALO16752.1 hypothetical protein L21SP5_03137 [Salinivirga cyanobacteriivorans]